MTQYYSQFGEDQFVIPYLPSVGIFVEVGAGDGKLLSNSLALEEQGWTGLLVEPDPRRNLSWRRAKVAKVAVASFNGSIRFHQHFNLDLSRPSRHGNIEVPTRRLDDLLEENDIEHIDLLSLDTEGSELEIWNDFNYVKYNPRIVIVEWNTFGLLSNEGAIREAFMSCNYNLIHKTEANLIYYNRNE